MADITILKEIEEAQQVALEALADLKEAQTYFQSASRWGWMDLFGGGMWISFIKQNKMRKGKDALAKAEASLRRLNKELKDVSGMGHVSFDSDVLDILDVWTDNGFVDMFVQDRIEKNKRAIDKAIRSVEEILEDLNDQQEAALYHE